MELKNDENGYLIIEKLRLLRIDCALLNQSVENSLKSIPLCRNLNNLKHLKFNKNLYSSRLILNSILNQKFNTNYLKVSPNYQCFYDSFLSDQSSNVIFKKLNFLT